jgi:hypothetical protein
MPYRRPRCSSPDTGWPSGRIGRRRTPGVLRPEPARPQARGFDQHRLRPLQGAGPWRPHARTPAPPPVEAPEHPGTSSANVPSTPLSNPSAGPATPPKSRCRIDQLNPPPALAGPRAVAVSDQLQPRHRRRELPSDQVRDNGRALIRFGQVPMFAPRDTADPVLLRQLHAETIATGMDERETLARRRPVDQRVRRLTQNLVLTVQVAVLALDTVQLGTHLSHHRDQFDVRSRELTVIRSTAHDRTLPSSTPRARSSFQTVAAPTPGSCSETPRQCVHTARVCEAT